MYSRIAFRQPASADQVGMEEQHPTQIGIPAGAGASSQGDKSVPATGK